MSQVSVRYIVHDMDETIAFYTECFGFEVEMHPGPGFAALSRGDLRLLFNTPSGPGGASQPMPDGRRPEPGGWNRILPVHPWRISRPTSRRCGVSASPCAVT